MSINTDPDSLDAILRKLAKDVELAVHTLYRRQAGPDTTQVRTERFVEEARARIAARTGQADAAPAGMPRRPTIPDSAPGVEGSGDVSAWTDAEAAAVTKCVLAWLPMGSPASAAPDSRCVAPGRELIPLWGERELARQAVRRVRV